ncbi:hypothetical protein ABKN59_007399 [Abortiporus biennis]
MLSSFFIIIGLSWEYLWRFLWVTNNYRRIWVSYESSGVQAQVSLCLGKKDSSFQYSILKKQSLKLEGGRWGLRDPSILQIVMHESIHSFKTRDQEIEAKKKRRPKMRRSMRGYGIVLQFNILTERFWLFKHQTSSAGAMTSHGRYSTYPSVPRMKLSKGGRSIEPARTRGLINDLLTFYRLVTNGINESSSERKLRIQNSEHIGQANARFSESSSRHIRTLCLVIVLVYKVRVQQCGVTDTSYMPMPQRCRCIRYLNLGPAVYIHRVMVSHFSEWVGSDEDEEMNGNAFRAQGRHNGQSWLSQSVSRTDYKSPVLSECWLSCYSRALNAPQIDQNRSLQSFKLFLITALQGTLQRRPLTGWFVKYL